MQSLSSKPRHRPEAGNNLDETGIPAMQMDTNLDPFALRAFGLCLNEPAVTGSCWEASILALIGPSRSTLDDHRGVVRGANGTFVDPH